MDIRIGLTESDRAAGYSSFDGYREGAEQLVVDVTVNPHPDEAQEVNVEEIAEAVFVATNSPYQVTGLAASIREALLDVGPIRSLSVGDTVEVAGSRLAVAPFGFETL